MAYYTGSKTAANSGSDFPSVLLLLSARSECVDHLAALLFILRQLARRTTFLTLYGLEVCGIQ